MQRIKLTLSYDGSSYSGWQIQTKPPGIKTIQGVVEVVERGMKNYG
jgi:tRNA U38,U39,U40 pseudouridine synthase TruA